MSIRGLFLICCMVCTALGAAAQGKISGKVYDSHSGQPVEYATVAILKVSDSSLVTGTVTEPNGAFSTNVANGRYLVRISFMGYHTFFYPKQVTIGNNSNSVNLGKIEISPNSTVMDEVRVTAERTMVEYQLDKRVVNVDKNLVSSGGTATDVLEQVPSVAVDNDGNVTLRGSSNVKVLINGRPYEMMGNDLETLLEQIPASTVESVEVITNSWSPPKPMSIESVMPSNHLILCHPLLLPSVFPGIRVFSNESALCIRWPKYWSLSFSISPSNEYSPLISIRMDWFDLP